MPYRRQVARDHRRDAIDRVQAGVGARRHGQHPARQGGEVPRRLHAEHESLQGFLQDRRCHVRSGDRAGDVLRTWSRKRCGCRLLPRHPSLQGLLMKPAATIRRTLPILLFTATACRQIACFDTVDLSTIQGNDSATVVLNGRRAACEPYEVVHGSPKALVANFLASTGCASEAAAFAKANAMGLKDTVGTWTDSAGDVAAAVMQAPLVIPLNILIMSGDLQSRSAPLRIAEAQSNVSAASQLFDDNQCGITFSIAALKDERRGNFTPDLLTADCALPD